MILSICIPSYNRFDSLQKTLDSIIKAKSQDFEVVIVDNGSSEDIYEKIKVNDIRVRIIKREKPLPANANVRTCLNKGRGKYVLLCLDKDHILGERLDQFIASLQNQDTITCGYCKLNSCDINGELIVNNNKIADYYRCGHPSGTFYKKSVLDSDIISIDNIINERKYNQNAFIIDLLYAFCLSKGDEGIFYGQLCVTETLNEAAKTKSYSYSKERNNIYFFPENRIKYFDLFSEHLILLGLSENNYSQIMAKVYDHTLTDCTVGFRQIMLNEMICSHHGINTKNITLAEMKAYGHKVREHFINSNSVHLSPLKKTMIFMKADMKLVARIALERIKK